GDGEVDVGPADIMRCDHASDAPWIQDDKHSAWQILAPLDGLYHVRGGHSAVLLRQAHDMLCNDHDHPRFVHFYLPADNGVAVPLNWMLSNQTAKFIWDGAFGDQQVPNKTEVDRLREALAPEQVR